jgi:hypothetical protein
VEEVEEPLRLRGDPGVDGGGLRLDDLEAPARVQEAHQVEEAVLVAGYSFLNARYE